MKFSTNPFGNAQNLAKATITKEALVSPSAQGRNVLAYIIEKQLPLTDGEYVLIVVLDVVNYFAERISTSYANYYNVRRGIANLIKVGILAQSNVRDKYWVNRNLLSK